MRFFVLSDEPSDYIGDQLYWRNMSECAHFTIDRNSWALPAGKSVVLRRRRPLSRALPDYFVCGVLSICSATLRHAFEQAAGHYEFLPVDHDFGDDRTYSVLHVQGRYDVVDTAASRFQELRMGLAYGVSWLVLDEAKLPADELFEVDCYSSLMVVAADVAERLRDFSGLRLTPIEEYRDEHHLL